jgi:tetratricopeptide (TPR) repeat protein
MIAEYGVVGWLFLFSLIAFLLHATYVTWANTSTQGLQEAPVRALVLASLLAFLLVSNAGFAWRMATTGALFAVSIAILMASDIRLLGSTSETKNTLRITPKATWLILYLLAILTTIAIYISQQAIECESKLVRAIKLAVTISHSPNPNDTRWDPAKAELLKLTHEGIAINPHYRKLTPIIADSLAGWGDWKNAIWIWESVLASRPHIVAMASNLARGHMQLREYGKAQVYLGRVLHLQPNTPASKTLEILLWSRTGRLRDAVQSSKEMLRTGSTDRDLLQNAYILGIQTKDLDLTIQALEIGIHTWPDRSVDGWLKLGDIYAGEVRPDEGQALKSYESALSNAQPAHRQAILSRIPIIYRQKLLQ